MSNKSDSKFVQSVVRALNILSVLASAENPLPLTKISNHTELHISTTHRLLNSLKACGYVLQDPQSGHYALGVKAITLSFEGSRIQSLKIIARPFLQEIVEKAQETANLVTKEGLSAVYVDQVTSPRMMRMFTQTGAEAPLHCTGVGKIFLAYMPEEHVRQLVSLNSLTPYTAQTITDPAKLLKELESIRSVGVAYDREEREEGVMCVAGPVFDQKGNVVASISISGPATRMAPKIQHEYAELIKKTCLEMSALLGFEQA